MKAYLLSDGEFAGKRHAELEELITGFLAGRGFDVKKKTIERDELAFCRGCFECWVKTPGECVIKDGIAEINRCCMQSDAVVYLCPVVFGQFSANIKSAIDRWLPNMLPFFMTRADGSTMHPPRYQDYPFQVFIGYGVGLTQEEKQLFTDISLLHRSNVKVLCDDGNDEALCAALMEMKFQRIGGAL